MKSILLVNLALFFCNVLLAQVDMTKYASNDLFKSKPIITKDFLEEDNEKMASEQMFQKAIEKGVELWETNQLDDAIEHFEGMNEEYDEVPYIHYLLGAILYDKERYDDAIESLTDALLLEPLFLEAKYLIGLIQLAQKNNSESRKTFESLLTVSSYASYGYFGLGKLEVRNQNYYKAKKMYEKCIENDPKFKDAYIPLTELDIHLFKANGIKKSLNRMNQAVEIDSTWQQARIIRAMLSTYKSNDSKQFVNDIDVLIRQAPNNYHYHSIKGYLGIEMQDYRAAVDNFRNALNLSIDTLNKGEYNFNSKLKKNKALQAAVNYYYQNFEHLNSKARNYIDQGICEFILNNNSKRALVYYESALHAQESPVIDYLKGVYFESQWGGDSVSVHYYQKALEKDTANFMAYSNRGNIYFRQKKYQLAFNDYSEMIKLRPRNKDGYKIRGALLVNVGLYLKAYRDLSSAIGIDSTDTDLFFDRGTSAYYAKYYDISIQDFNKVIERKPRDGDAYYMLAQNNLQKKDTLACIALLDSASKYKKYNDDFHNELLSLSKSKDLKDKMEVAYNRLVKYNWFTTKYLLERGKFYFENKDFEKAFIDLKDLVKRNNKNGEGYYFLGKTQIKRGQIKSGNKYLEKAKKLGYKE